MLVIESRNGTCYQTQRVATVKQLPTDEEVFEHGYEDAGDFLLGFRKAEPQLWKEFMLRTRRAFEAPLPQPIFRLVDHTCSLLSRAHGVHLSKKKKKGN